MAVTYRAGRDAHNLLIVVFRVIPLGRRDRYFLVEDQQMWHRFHSQSRPAKTARVRRIVCTTALSLLLTLWVVPEVSAGTPLLQYHDCLVDKTGFQLPDGTYNVNFKIYSNPSRLGPLWESDGPVAIQLEAGCFTYVLGSAKRLPKTLNDYTTVWVGIAVESGVEMSPRTSLDVKQAHAAAQSSGAVYTGNTESGSGNLQRVFPDLYFHAGISFGLGSTSPGETYEQLIAPWQTGTGAGYGLGLAVGFRNIYQFQYRPQVVTSSDLNRFQADSVIPLDYHVNNEFVHKLNVLCFRRPTSARVPVIFLTFGTASTGSVKQVDELGSGFVQGSSTMLGLEVGLLSRLTQLGFYVERRATTFRNIYLQQIGTFQEDVDATFWSVGLQISVGTGLFF